jgi:hypothetical protein
LELPRFIGPFIIHLRRVCHGRHRHAAGSSLDWFRQQNEFKRAIDSALAELNSMVSVSKSIDDQLGSGGEGVGP